MKHHEIVTQIAVGYSEIIYAVTMDTVLSAIVKRMGEEALTLTVEQIELAKEEVVAVIEHNLDIRDYIDMGLGAWEITCNL